MMATITRDGSAADRLEAALLSLSRGSFPDPDDLLRHALAEGAAALDVPHAAAWKLDRLDPGRLTLRAIHSPDPDAASPTVLETPGSPDSWPRTWTTGIGPGGSALCAGFWRSSVPTGLLRFYSGDATRVWTDAERIFAAALAEHIAAALDRIEKDRLLHTSLIEAEAEAERALRESEESYRTIFELAGEAIFVHDPVTGTVLDANRAACELHGITLDELKRVGISGISDGRPPYDAARVRELVQRAAAGEPQRFEWLGRHSSGTHLWMEVSLNGVMILGEKRVLATVRNITERKEADARLHSAYTELERRVAFRTEQLEQAKEAAERANRAKSEFLSRMSHELRTPMNSILGFAQVLARSELSPQDARSVQHVLRAGRHLLQLINEVLDIARIESGRHALSLEPVHVDSVVREACGMVRPLSTQWSVNLEVSTGTCADVYVRADRQRLAQVLLNLLANAIKYNRRDGTVYLRCGRAPSDDGGNDRLVIRVQDTGRGIPADKVDQLFAPFNRLGAEQSEIEGTGLGLALSQRLTEAMGGTLRLESTGPEGSVFRVDLEMAQDTTCGAEDPVDEMPVVVDASHGPATLLYIEENLANLSLVETILLSRPKWRTLPALQGRIGLELAREHSPDLILLDLHLPDIHGGEVLRRLRLDDHTANIPVVVVSADATPSTVERMLAAGAAAFVPKPLDIDEFLETIERLLPAAATGR